jgi:hypothetical protein
MAKKTARIGLTASALIRLLASLAEPRGRTREAQVSFADALSQWTGWTDAIALSAALDKPVPQTTSPLEGDKSVQAEWLRLQESLAQAIVRETQAAGRSPLEAGLGYAPFRQCFVARQQAMDVAVGALRDRVRAVLAGASADLARLAAVDAAMAQALAPQERRLLAALPAQLEKYYQQLRAAQAADDLDRPGAEAWVEAFRRDLQAILLAELEHRLQPVEGMLQALTPSTPLRTT